MSLKDILAAAGILALLLLLFLLILNRFRWGRGGSNRFPDRGKPRAGGGWAICQTMGNRERQADFAQAVQTRAGTMAVLADGIGKENTGKLCGQIAGDTVLDSFEPYDTLNNPSYLYSISFREAHHRIQKTIGDRQGGACLGAVFTDGRFLHYGLVGNIRIALFRNGELIPLSKGHTMDVLAVKAYGEGRLTKKETIWSLEETGVWNYLGKDGFHEIEFCPQPIRLKGGDLIMMISCGVFQELSWAEIEDILAEDLPLQEKAESLVWAAAQKPGQDKENGSVMLLRAEVLDEKDQF